MDEFGGIPVEQATDEFGGVPVDSPTTSSNTPIVVSPNVSTPAPLDLAASRQQAQTNMEAQARTANEQKGMLQRAGEGYLRGAEQGGIGIMQGFHLGNQEDLRQIAKNLETQGKGAGVAGTAGEIIGNPVNDATLAVPGMGLAGRAAVGAAQGYLQPTTEESHQLGNTLTGAAVNAIIPPVIGKATGALGKAAQIAANKTGLTDAAAAVMDKLGSKPTTSKIYQAAKDTGFDIKGKSPKEIADNLQAWLSANHTGIAQSISGKQFDPIDANVAISKNYGKALNTAKDLYTNAKQIGVNDVIPANDLDKNITGLIQNIAAKPIKTSKENGALSKLMELRNNLQENSLTMPGYNVATDPYLGVNEGTIPKAVPVNTLIDLKQIANQYFDKSEPDPLFSKVFSLAKNGLNQASEQNPEFGAALAKADKYWGQEVAPTYTDNKLLDKFWNTDDFHDANALVNRGQKLPLELRKRSSEWIDKIKSPEELESITNALPQDHADALSAQVAKNMLEKTGFNTKTLADPKKYALMQKAAQGNPKVLENLDNMRTILADLNLRGLDNSMSDNVAREALQGKNSTKEAMKALWSNITGHKMYAISHAAKAAAGIDGATGEALKGFQANIVKGAPFKQSISNAANYIAPGLGKAANLATLNATQN